MGRDALRHPPRRFEGLRLRDALRRGLGPLRRVRPVLHRHGGHPGRRAGCPRRVRARPWATSRSDWHALGRVVVAFSGGADSSLLAKVAHDTLGRTSVLCATALSPSLAGGEADDCRALAGEWGLRWVGVPTDEMDDPAYVANGSDRCAHCKSALMRALGPLAAEEGATVVLGVNVERPGRSPPRAGRRGRARCGLPARRGRVHEGRHP